VSTRRFEGVHKPYEFGDGIMGQAFNDNICQSLYIEILDREKLGVKSSLVINY
jgi:hypothetical protein